MFVGMINPESEGFKKSIKDIEEKEARVTALARLTVMNSLPPDDARRLLGGAIAPYGRPEDIPRVMAKYLKCSEEDIVVIAHTNYESTYVKIDSPISAGDIEEVTRKASNFAALVYVKPLGVVTAVFRGSQSLQNFCVDDPLVLGGVDYEKNPAVHNGISLMEAFEEALPRFLKEHHLTEKPPIVYIGHSLGCLPATVCGARFGGIILNAECPGWSNDNIIKLATEPHYNPEKIYTFQAPWNIVHLGGRQIGNIYHIPVPCSPEKTSSLLGYAVMIGRIASPFSLPMMVGITGGALSVIGLKQTLDLHSIDSMLNTLSQMPTSNLNLLPSPVVFGEENFELSMLPHTGDLNLQGVVQICSDDSDRNPLEVIRNTHAQERILLKLVAGLNQRDSRIQKIAAHWRKQVAQEVERDRRMRQFAPPPDRKALAPTPVLEVSPATISGKVGKDVTISAGIGIGAGGTVAASLAMTVGLAGPQALFGVAAVGIAYGASSLWDKLRRDRNNPVSIQRRAEEFYKKLLREDRQYQLNLKKAPLNEKTRKKALSKEREIHEFFRKNNDKMTGYMCKQHAEWLKKKGRVEEATRIIKAFVCDKFHDWGAMEAFRLSAGQYGKLEQAVAEVLRINPHDKEVLTSKFNLYYEAYQCDRMLYVLNELNPVDRVKELFHHKIACVILKMMKEGRIDEAEKQLKSAKEIHSDYLPYDKLYLDIKQKKGATLAEQRNLCDEIIGREKDPKEKESYQIEKARIFYEEKKADQGIKLLEDLLSNTSVPSEELLVALMDLYIGVEKAEKKPSFNKARNLYYDNKSTFIRIGKKGNDNIGVLVKSFVQMELADHLRTHDMSAAKECINQIKGQWESEFTRHLENACERYESIHETTLHADAASSAVAFVDHLFYDAMAHIPSPVLRNAGVMLLAAVSLGTEAMSGIMHTTQRLQLDRIRDGNFDEVTLQDVLWESHASEKGKFLSHAIAGAKSTLAVILQIDPHGNESYMLVGDIAANVAGGCGELADAFEKGFDFQGTIAGARALFFGMNVYERCCGPTCYGGSEKEVRIARGWAEPVVDMAGIGAIWWAAEVPCDANVALFKGGLFLAKKACGWSREDDQAFRARRIAAGNEVTTEDPELYRDGRLGNRALENTITNLGYQVSACIALKAIGYTVAPQFFIIGELICVVAAVHQAQVVTDSERHYINFNILSTNSYALHQFSEEDLNILKGLPKHVWKLGEESHEPLFSKIQALPESEEEYKSTPFTSQEGASLKKILEANNQNFLSEKLALGKRDYKKAKASHQEWVKLQNLTNNKAQKAETAYLEFMDLFQDLSEFHQQKAVEMETKANAMKEKEPLSFAEAEDCLVDQIQNLDAIITMYQSTLPKISAEIAAYKDFSSKAQETFTGIEEAHSEKKKTLQELESHRDSFISRLNRLRAEKGIYEAYASSHEIYSDYRKEFQKTQLDLEQALDWYLPEAPALLEEEIGRLDALSNQFVQKAEVIDAHVDSLSELMQENNDRTNLVSSSQQVRAFAEETQKRAEHYQSLIDTHDLRLAQLKWRTAQGFMDVLMRMLHIPEGCEGSASPHPGSYLLSSIQQSIQLGMHFNTAEIERKSRQGRLRLNTDEALHQGHAALLGARIVLNGLFYLKPELPKFAKEKLTDENYKVFRSVFSMFDLALLAADTVAHPANLSTNILSASQVALGFSPVQEYLFNPRPHDLLAKYRVFAGYFFQRFTSEKESWWTTGINIAFLYGEPIAISLGWALLSMLSETQKQEIFSQEKVVRQLLKPWVEKGITVGACYAAFKIAFGIKTLFDSYYEFQNSNRWNLYCESWGVKRNFEENQSSKASSIFRRATASAGFFSNNYPKLISQPPSAPRP